MTSTTAGASTTCGSASRTSLSHVASSFGRESGGFSVVSGTPTEHAHVAFPAHDDATVDEFHRAAIAAGSRDDGPPGERPVYHPGYYAAYILDPDGNSVELVNHNRGA